MAQETLKPAATTMPEKEADAPETDQETMAEAESATVKSEKEDSNVASDLPETHRKALEELKELVREALNKREFTAPPPPPPEKREDKAEEKKTDEEENKVGKMEETEEVKPAAPAEKLEVAQMKTQDKPAADEETKKEETATAPAAVDAKKEEKPVSSDTLTIERAFAADEDGAKTVEAIKESIVPVSTPEATAAAAAEEPKEAEAPPQPAEPEEVSIWGIPLLRDERSDVILLKFLRARDFKVKEAFSMLKNTVSWRKDFKIDEVLEEDLGSEFEEMVFVHGIDKQGRTVIYSSYSEFQNKKLFSDKEKRYKFLKWRIQFQEKCVRALDFSPTAKSSFVFISDFKNAPGLGKRALWQFIKQAVKLFEDNYPEFVAKEVFINVPWWYIPYYRTIGSFTSPGTRSKMSLAGPSKSADAIFRYVTPERVPVKYGGLSKEAHPDQLFTPEDAITDVTLKPTAKHTIELPASEACTLAWELRVLGSDVSYGAQFEPSTEGSYAVIVSKNRKIGWTDEPVITDSFKVGEPGKVVITIDNQTSKKKKLLYRFKTQPRSD